jgi:DNA-binding transcriptional MerR regulator
MTTTKYAMTIVRSKSNLISIEEAAAHFGIHEQLARCFVEYGLLEPAEVTGSRTMLDAAGMHRLGVIHRLRRDLGINLPGIGVILELLDRGHHGHQ